MSMEAWDRQWGGLPRRDLLRAAPPAWVTPVDGAWFETLLLLVRQRGVAVRLGRCLGGQGLTGPVVRTALSGPLDRVVTDVAGLVLCAGPRTVGLAQASLAQLYWLRQPDALGLLQCVEGYDRHGALAWRLSGEDRQPGADRCAWRQVLVQMADELGEAQLAGSPAAAPHRPVWTAGPVPTHGLAGGEGAGDV